MDKRRLKALIVFSVFLTGFIGFYQMFDVSLNTEIELDSKGELTDGAGYEEITLNITNNEENSIEPRFYIIEPTAKGPHRLFMDNKTSIGPSENTSVTLSPHNYTYIAAEEDRFTVLMEDLKTGQTAEKTLYNQVKIENSTIRNTELVSFGGKPPGWKELFTGTFTDLRFNKNMKGVEIERFPRTKLSRDMGYYLAQEFNLTEYIAVEARFNNLSRTSTGIRVLPANSSTTSKDGVIKIDFTERKDFKQNETNLYSLRKLFREQEAKFELNQTMKLQFYYEAEEGRQNSFFLDRIEPTNRKT